MLIKERKNLFEYLCKLHKKLSRSKVNCNIYFFIFFFMKLNRSKFNFFYLNIEMKLISIKFYYVLIYLLIKTNFKSLDKILFRLKFKDNLLLLTVNNKLSKININYFFKKNSNKVILYNDYKFRIDLFNFLVYGKYIEHIRKSLYNEYLTLVLRKFPLLKSLLRLILYQRNLKLNDSKSNLSNLSLFSRFNIFDNSKVIIENNIICNNLQNVILSLINCKLLKLIHLWKGWYKTLFYYIDYFFNKNIKCNLLFIVYIINVFNTSDDNDIYKDEVEINKFEARGLYSLYWQMNRYGFDFDNSYYYRSLINLFSNNNLLNINDYYLYYLKTIIINKNKCNSIYWYKIINLIVLNFTYNSFFRFLKFNRFKLWKRRNKYLKRLIIWKNILQNYSFIFIPISFNIYSNDIALSKYILNSKYLVDNSFIYIYYSNIVNISMLLNYNLTNLNLKINMDNILNKDFDFYLNLFLFFISKRVGKYFFINVITQFITIKDLITKSLENLINNVNKDLVVQKIRKYYLFIKQRDRGLDLYYIYHKKYNIEYIWKFEDMMTYSSYIILMNYYYIIYYNIILYYYLLYK